MPGKGIPVGSLRLHPENPLLCKPPDYRGRHFQFFHRFFIGKCLFLKERCKKSGFRPVVLPFVLPEKHFSLWGRNQAHQFPALFLPGLLLYQKDRFQSLIHGGAIPLFHPRCQSDQLRLRPDAALHDSCQLLDLLRRIIRFVGKSHHIPFCWTVSPAKRNLHLHTGLQAALQPFRDPILEDPVHLLMGNIHNDIDELHIRILIIVPHPPLTMPRRILFYSDSSCSTSRIRSLSSMGYFFPLIS